MIIDCDDCALQHTAACADCVVTHLLGITGRVEVSEGEAEALDHLAGAGLVAPLRLVSRRGEGDGDPTGADTAGGDHPDDGPRAAAG